MPRPARRLTWATVLLLAGGATAVALASPSGAAPGANADYQLQNSLTSSTPGAAALANVAKGNTFISTTVDRTSDRKVLRYPKGSGLALGSALSSIRAGTYTVVILYRPLVVDGSYHRILDLNAGVGDTGLYERGGALAAYPQQTSTATPITTGAFSQVVLTRTAGKVVTGYVNGRRLVSFTDSSGGWLAKNLIRFGKDNTSGGATGEETGGQFARIRLYDTALSGSEVSGLDRLSSGAADVGVSYVDSPDPVAHGSFLSYTATLVNTGSTGASNVTASLTLPAGAAYQGASPSAGSCAPPAGGKVQCSLGDLALGRQVQVLLVLKAPTGTGSISSTVTAVTTTPDQNHANDRATQSTTVR